MNKKRKPDGEGRPGAGRPPRPKARLACLELERRDVPATLLTLVSSSPSPSMQLVTSKFGDDVGFLFHDYSLWALSHRASTSSQTAASYQPSPDQPNVSALQIAGDQIAVETVSKGDDTAPLIAELNGQGVQVTGSYGRMVSAVVPIAKLSAVSMLPDFNFGFAEYRPVVNAGQVDDQAVQAMRTDVGSKQFGVDGTGVTVGLLSDSFNNLNGYNADITSGDLPAGVNVLKDESSGGADEGRAMAQLVHDVAPGSSLAFYTAFVSEADFASGITKLATPVAQGGAGAKVIADDVFYYHEPMFQDGVIAQAINNAVTTNGVTEFSSAGNFGRDAYQSAFNSTTASVPTINGGAATTFHNFNPNGTADIFQPITIANNSTFTFSFQWDQPYASASTGSPGTAGSQNSVAVYLLNSDKSTIVQSSTSNLVGQDPFRFISFNTPSTGSSQYYLVFQLTNGAAPGQMKYILFGNGTIGNYATNTGASFGHSGAANAAGVAAAYFKSTPAYGVTPAAMESYSSAGGTAYLFDAAGNRLATPDLRQQPRFTSTDGSDTTFFDSFNSNGDRLNAFFGTSAAAPHAAAVAALLDQEVPTLTSSQIYSILQNTAAPTTNNPTGGFNFDTGYGLIQADKALEAAAGIGISGTVFRDYNNNGTQDPNDPGEPGVTVFLDSNSNGLLDSATSGPLVSTDVPKAIPDFGSPTANFPSRVTSNLTVSGLTGRVTKVTVNLSVTHTFDRDLGLTLISPSGMRIPLVSNAGSSGDNFTNTVFDDAASTSIQNGAAPFTGTFHPQVALAALNGENPNGTWQLEGRDYEAADTGTILSWSLTITSADPSTTTDSNGHYSFANLAASAYYGPDNVREIVPALFTETSPVSPPNLTLGIGQQAANVNLGNFAPIVTIDDGSAQRSMVRKIVIILNGNIPLGNILAGAITLTQTSGLPASFSTSVFSVTALGGNQTAVELHFSGTDVIGGSLADGRYTLNIDGSKITDATGAPVDAAGTGTPGSIGTQNFLRFYADINGDGHVDGADFFVFRQAFGAPSTDPAYLSYLDYDNDGFINGTEFFQFKARFGGSI